MEPVQIVRQVFFPLDEELCLLPGSLTPKQQEHLAHLSTWMPFERAREMLEKLLGVQVSEPTVRRATLRVGALSEARQTAQSQQPATSAPEVTPCEKLVISTDGAYVPLVGGQWAEVRTVAIGEVKEKVTKRHKEIQTQQLSYFSRMTDCVTFGERAQGEMQRRGVSQAKAVCAVTDGADWIQGFVDLHRPDALRVLDFPHAAEHINLLIQALQPAGVVLPEDVLERTLHVLKHRGPGLLLRWCDRLPAAITEQEAVHKHLNYLRKRASLMQYPAYQRQGWPIGSGMVESANKVVVQARLKGAGMHWEPTHVNPMLTLRAAACSQRWDEGWQELLQEHQTQLARTRQQRVSARFESSLSSLMLLLLRFRPPTPTPKPTLPPVPRLVEPAATLPGSSRPSAHHPWKKGPACRPQLSAKK
jgi:hypothetical protein